MKTNHQTILQAQTPAQAFEEAVQEALLMAEFFSLTIHHPDDSQLYLLDNPVLIEHLRATEEYLREPMSITEFSVFNKSRRERPS